MFILKNNNLLLTSTGFWDPLEQFEVFDVICRFFSNLNVHIFAVFFFILAFLWKGNIASAYNTVRGGSDNWFWLQRKAFFFILTILKENLNIKVLLYFPVVYITFLFIFFSNIIGMVPYSFTITSSFVITFFLSCQFFVGVTIIGYTLHRNNFFQMFLPSGVPLVIAPALVVIELISYFARVLSLAIRLFANMMSGHSLLKILGGFVWVMLSSGGLDAVLAIMPIAVVLLVTCLETAIAFLQAYVFTVLISIYINDVINTH